MKKILKIAFILTMILINNKLIAQPGGNATPTLVPCSFYIQSQELDKFVGTWKWTSGNDSFEIVLKKEKISDLFDEDTCEDIIYGFHEYKKNNNIIESSLQYANTTFVQQKNTIYSPNFVVNSFELRGGIDNLSKGNNRLKFRFLLIDSNHIEIKSLDNYDGVKAYLPGIPIPPSEINLPIGIILSKQ